MRARRTTRHAGRWAAVGLCVAVCLGVAGDIASDAPPTDPPAAAGGRTISIGAAPGRAIAPSFVGLSLEYWTFARLAGPSPRAVNPMLIALLRGLAVDGPPQLRIGGNSADQTFADPGGGPMLGLRYVLPPRWMAVLAHVLRATGSTVVLDGNLAAGRPDATAALLRRARRTLTPAELAGIAIGNEPDLFPTNHWYRDTARRLHAARRRGYRVGTYLREYRASLAALRRTGLRFRLVGPDLGGTKWLKALPTILRAVPIRLETAHIYALSGCGRRRGHRGYPTTRDLLAEKSSHGVVRRLGRELHAARRAGLPVRVEEGNSVACAGVHGVSDAPAAALWAPDLLFELAQAGVRGMNFHNAGAPYDVMTARRRGRRWRAHVSPLFHGLQLFESTLGPGAHLLAVTGRRPRHVKVWATIDARGVRRVLILNKTPRRPVRLRLHAEGASSALATWLTAAGRGGPAVDGHRLLGWVSRLGFDAPDRTRVPFAAGLAAVGLPPLSAVVLELPAGEGAPGGACPFQQRAPLCRSPFEGEPQGAGRRSDVAAQRR